MPPTEYISLSEVKTILDQGSLQNVNPKWEFNLVTNELHPPYVWNHYDSTINGDMWALYGPGVLYNIQVFNHATYGNCVILSLTNQQGTNLTNRIIRAADSVFEVPVADGEDSKQAPVYQIGTIHAVMNNKFVYFFNLTAFQRFVESEEKKIAKPSSQALVGAELLDLENFTLPSIPECKLESDSLNYRCFEYRLRNAVSSNFSFPDFQYIYGNGGKAIVEFVITKTGNISHYSIVQTSGSDAIDIEAVRAVVSINMPIQPAMKDGEPTRFIFRVPINAKVQ
ncbi:MAG: energy transducer TonB [Flavobacteriia bacterium]|nr:energy transducer TonB [Flavobacteriia bacterium]